MTCVRPQGTVTAMTPKENPSKGNDAIREGNGTLLDWRLVTFGNASKLGSHKLLALPESSPDSESVRKGIEESVPYEMFRERLVQLGRDCKLSVAKNDLLVNVSAIPNLHSRRII